MTRASLNRTLRWVYVILGLVLAISVLAKFADRIPGIAGTPLERIATDTYDYLKDMALVLVTVVAAYLANVFQKRSKFLQSLEQEWRGIVRTKAAIYTFCERENPTLEDYLAAYRNISETIDSMRIVYRNSGETDELVGLYPFSPLHDMRRALETLDPCRRDAIPAHERALVREAIVQSFFAMRETFLDEMDLQEPTNPLLIAAGRRLKTSGATKRALSLQNRQRTRQNANPARRPDVEVLLMRLYDEEQALLHPAKQDAAQAQTPADPVPAL